MVLGGVPRRGIYDNMRTAVDRVRRGKERDVNARFAAMASHFLFEAEFCNPASGWEKGQVEKNVRDARHRLWLHISDRPGHSFRSELDMQDGSTSTPCSAEVDSYASATWTMLGRRAGVMSSNSRPACS